MSRSDCSCSPDWPERGTITTGSARRDYWLWVGGIFSALEPLPILLMVFDTMHHVKERKAKIVNPLTWTYAIGCAVMHFIGAGVWGFLHTLPQINYYTHGSQVTVSHGHLAFFGAYALLNLMTFYYAMPKMKGIAAYDDRRGKIGFWTMCSAMMIMGLTFGVAGVLQSYIERVLGMGYMVAQGYMRLWMGVTMVGGRLLPRGTAHHRRGPLHVAAGEDAGVTGPSFTLLQRGTGALDARQGLRSPGSRTIISRNGEDPGSGTLLDKGDIMDRYTKGFVVASLVYFFLAAVLGIWMGGSDAAGWVRFAHVHFNLLGFMAMMIYGVGYFILPRFNGRTLRWPSWVPIHFFLANIGLIGMVATVPERPSTGFILFSALSVISTGMFAVNLGATMLMEPKKEEEEEPASAPAAEPSAAASGATSGPSPAAPPPAAPKIDPDMRVGEILTRWPQAVDVFVGHGFSSLANAEHREQVKQIPITLRMACQRHNVDLDYMVAELSEAIAPAPPKTAAATKTAPAKRGEEGETRQGGDDRGGPHPRGDPRGVPRDGEGVPEILRRRLLLLPRAGDGVREAERDDAQREREAAPLGAQPRRGVLNRRPGTHYELRAGGVPPQPKNGGGSPLRARAGGVPRNRKRRGQ